MRSTAQDLQSQASLPNIAEEVGVQPRIVSIVQATDGWLIRWNQS